MPEKQSSLDRILTAQGCPGLDKLIAVICEDCPHKKVCEMGKMRCKALHTMLTATAKTSVKSETGQVSIRSYFEILTLAANE